MREARVQLALLRFARLIVSQLGSVSSLSLIPTIHSFSSLRVQSNTHGGVGKSGFKPSDGSIKAKAHLYSISRFFGTPISLN